MDKNKDSTESTRGQITNKGVTVSISDFDFDNPDEEWLRGVNKEMVVTVDFESTNPTNKKVHIDLPEGMRFVEYRVKGTPRPGTPEVSLTGQTSNYVKASYPVSKQPHYQSYNGRLTYEIEDNVPRIELIMVVTVDEYVYYGPKTIIDGIKVSASQGVNTNVGEIRKDIKGSGAKTHKAADVRTGTNMQIAYGDTNVFSHPQTYMGYGVPYFKKITLYYYLPEGVTNVTAPYDWSYDEDTNIVKIVREHTQKTRDIYFNGIKSNVDGLEKKIHSMPRNYMEVEYYDGVKEIFTSDRNNDLIVKDPGENSAPMSWYRQRTSDYGENDFGKIVTFAYNTTAIQDYNDQRMEINIPSNFDADTIVFPKTVVPGKDMKVEYYTLSEPTVAKTAIARTDNYLVNSNSAYYYINKRHLEIGNNDKIVKVIADIGFVPRNSTSNLLTALTFPGIYGKSDSATNEDISFEILSYGEKDGVKTEPFKMTAKGTYYANPKDDGLASTLRGRTDDFLIPAGTSKKYEILIDMDQFNDYAQSTVNKNLSVIMKIPEGVHYEDIQVTKNYKKSDNIVRNEIIDVNISAPYTKKGEQYIKINFNDGLGLLVNNEFIWSYIVKFNVKTSQTASVNTTSDKMFWIDSDQHPYTNIIDKDDISNSGTTTNRIRPVNPTDFLISKSADVSVDTYIIPDGGQRQNPYDPDDNSTAIGFTPNSEGTYNVELVNNRTDDASKMIMYIPVPKTGYNFGKEFQLNDFAWDMKLNGSHQIEVYDINGNNVTDSKKNNYEVSYSSIVSDENDFEEDQPITSSTKYSNIPDSNVRMIRIRNISGISQGERVVLKFKYVASEDKTSAQSKLGKVNDFRPYFYTIAGSEGPGHGTRVGAVLQMGTFSGYVFNDANKNGLMDVNEGLKDRTVKAKNLNSGAVETTKTDASGKYTFEDLPVADFEIDFTEALTGSEKFTFIKTETNGSKVPNRGANTGKFTAKPTDDGSENINAGIISHTGDDTFKNNISLSKLELVEPYDDGTPHTLSEKDATLTFNPTTIKEFVNGDITYTSADPSLVKVTKVDNYNIKVEALRKTPEISGEATTTITVTFTDIYGSKTTKDFPVSVRSNDRPIISVNDDFFKLEKGQTYTTANDTGLTLTDTEQPGLTRGDIVPDFKGQSLNEVGIYEIDLTFTDTDGNAAVVQQRKIVVWDADNQEIDGHLVRFNKSYTIDLKDYPKELDDKKAEAFDVDHGNIKITKIADNSNVTPSFVFNTYKEEYGDQFYTFTFNGKSGNEVTNRIDVKVTDNGEDIGTHFLLAENAYISKKQAAAIKSDFAAQSLVLTNARAEAKDGSGSVALDYVGVNPTFSETPGVYTVTYKHTSSGKTLTADIHVLDFDEVVHVGEYLIAANNFIIGKEDVKLGATDLVERAGAVVYKVTDLNTDLGAQTGSVLDAEETNAQTVTFTPTKTGLPAALTIDVDATVEGDKVINGDEYVLVIKENITIQKHEAETYISEGFGDSNSIITKAGAKAKLRTDLSVEGTVKYTASTFTATSSGTATFVVEQDETATATIPVTVITDNNKPVITIDNAHKVVKIPVGDTVFNSSEAYKTGVTAVDVDNSSNALTFDNGKLKADPKTIDTSKPGVHTIKYDTTDLNGLDADSVYKIVVVGDDIPKVGDYYVYANNIAEEVSVFKSLDEAATKAKIVDLSEGYAVHSITGEKVSLEVDSLNTFAAKAGTYTVDLKVVGDTSGETAPITVKLTDGDVVKGDKYYITANDVTGGLSVARAILEENNNDKLFEVMDVTVTPIHGNEVYNMNKVTVTNKIDEVKAQDWPMTFTVDDDQTAFTNKTLTITKDEEGKIENDLYLGASPFVIGQENIANNLTQADYIAYSGVNAYRDSTNDPLGFAVKSGTELDGTVGETTITFEVAGHPARTETVKVLVVPGKTVVDANYVLAGKDFSITGKEALDIKNDVANSDNHLLTNRNAHLKSYARYTIDEAGSVVVSDSSTITNVEKVGGYTTKFKVSGETTPELSLQVSVDMGTAPVLNVKDYTVLNVGENFDPRDGFINGTALNDDIAQDAMTFEDLDSSMITGTVDKNKVGVYEITYAYEDSYGRSTSEKHLVVVTDGSIEVTDKHIIYAENVLLKVDQIQNNAEANIKTASKPYAYVIETGAKVADSDISIQRGNVEAKAGTYTSHVKVAGDDKTKSIIVGVTEGEVIEGENHYLLTGKGATIGKDRAQVIIDDGTNVELFKTMNVIAIHKTSKDPVRPEKILVTNKITEAKEQVRTISFEVDGDEDANADLDLKVTDDDKVNGKDGIYVGARPFVVGRNNVAAMNVDKEQYVKYAAAHGWDANNGDAPINAVAESNLNADPAVNQRQTMTFSVTKGSVVVKETVDVLIVDGTTVFDDNADYVIAGQDFDINGVMAKNLVDNPQSDNSTTSKQLDADLIATNGSRLQSFKKYSLENAGEVIVVDRTNIVNTESTVGYNTVFGVKDDSVQITLKVRVSMGEAPQLVTRKVSELAVGESFDPEVAFVEGSATNDGIDNLQYSDLDEDLFEGLAELEANKNTVGVYKVVYKYTDATGQTATSTTLVYVNDGSIQLTDKHLIYGENVTMKPSEVDANKATTIKSRSNAYAYNLETGLKVDDSLISVDANKVVAEDGTYDAFIKVAGDAVGKRINVLVAEDSVTNGDYTISAYDAKITEEEALDTTNLDATVIRKSRATGVHKTHLDPLEVFVTHSIDLTKTTHDVEYYVNEIGKTVKAASITKEVEIIEDKYEDNDKGLHIKGNGFIVEKDKVSTLSEGDYIDLAGVETYHETDVANIYTPYIIGNLLDENDTNVQYITFGVKRGNVKLDKPTITVDALVVDGNVVVGDKYTLVGENFTISGALAKLIKDDTIGQYDSNLISGGSVKSYLNGTTIEDGTVVVHDKSAIDTDEDTYEVQYRVEDADGNIADKPTLPLDVSVVLADAPELKIISNSSINITLNESFDPEAQFVEGYDHSADEAFDYSSDRLSVKVGTQDISEVTFTEVGIYKVVYTYTDTSDQTVSKTHTLAVTDGSIIEDQGYYIYAQNATIKLDDLKAMSDADLMDEVVDQVNPSATKIADGTDVAADRITILGLTPKPTQVGEYTLTIAIDDVATLKTVTLHVTNGTPNKVGKYTLIVNDTYITQEEANLPKAQLDALIIDRSGTKAVHDTLPTLGDVLVSHSINDTPGKQTVTYSIDGQAGSDKDAYVTVREGEIIGEDQDVYLEANPFIIGKEQVKSFNDETDFAKYIEAAGATAWSDHVSGPFVIKVVTSTKLKENTGLQTVEYYVDGYPDTKIPVTVLVTDGEAVVGDEFTISAKNVSVSAANAQLILDGANDQTNMIFGSTYANVKVYDNKTLQEVTENVTFDKKTLATTGATYPVSYTVVNDPKASIEKTVTVSTGEMPELIVPSYQQVTLGDMSSYNLLAGVQLKDNNINGFVTPLRVTHDENEFNTTNEAGLVYINHDNFDINTEAIYIVEYKAQDTNFNIATGKQAVAVSKESLPVSNDYSIYAENVVLDYHTQVANKTDAQIIQTILNEAHGYAVHTKNLTTHSITISSLPSNFVKDESVNKVEVHVVGDTSAKTDITVTITRGTIDKKGDYTISYNNAYFILSELEGKTPVEVKDLVIDRANATITPKLGQTTVPVDYEGTVSIAEGDYPVKFHIAGDNTVIADDFANVNVKDADVIEDLGDYVMTAKNFPIGINDIDSTTLGQYSTLADLVIEHKVTKVQYPATTMVKPNKVEGLQDTEYTFTRGEYTNSIIVEADVMAGNVVTKEKYSIKAEPVEISVEEALAIVDEIANDDITTIAGLAEVKAFETKTNTPKDYIMVADSSTIVAEDGDYEIWFKVDTTEEDVRIKVDVKVDAGEKPELEVEDYVELPFGTTTYDRRDAIIKAFDKNKQVNIPFADVEIIADNLDLTTVGFYSVKYKVTDANLNTETAETTILVNDGSYEIIGDYMFKAKNFAIEKADVYSGNAANVQLKEMAEVSAYNYVEKKAVSDNNIIVHNNGGYKAVADEYAVVFAIRSTNPLVTKAIDVTVTEEEVVNGGLYSITGKGLTIGQVDAKAITSEQDLVDLMGVKVIKRVASAPDSDISVDNFNEFSTAPNTYPMMFSVDEEPDTKDEYNLEVVDGDHVIVEGVYTLVADDFFVGLEDLNDLTYISPEKLVELASAYATRTIGSNKDRIPAKWISGPNKQLGHQEVIYAVAERTNMKMPVTATVLDGRVTESENYYITALSTTAPVSDLKLVQSGQKDIQNIMSVKVIDKETGLEVPNMAVTVTDMDALEAKPEVYTIEFNFVDNGETYTVKPKLTLSIGNPPTITVPKVQNVDLNNPVYDPELNIVMEDTEDDNNILAPDLVAIYDDSQIQDAITNKKVGHYTVKYTTVDFDGNTSNPAYQTVIVNDGSIKIGDDYALEAHNFSINIQDVVANDDIHLREKTGAKAIKLGSNNEYGTVTFATDYKAEVGDYDIDLAVVEDNTVTDTVVATVTKDKVKETLNYTISAADAFLGLKDAANVDADMLIAVANAKAKDKRLGTPEDVEVVSHTVAATAGVYEVIFKVKDVDVAEEDTTFKVKVTVLASKYVVIEDEYVLAADDFYVGEKDITNGLDNEAYVELARAYAFNRYDRLTEYDVKMDETTAPVNADRDVRYYVDQQSTTDVDVRAHVLTGEVVQGDDYYVKAEPTTIFVSQAIKVLDGTLDIRTLVSAESKSLDGTQTSDVKVKENKIKAEHGVYDVTFVSENDPTAEITIKVTVDKGLKPVLTVPTYTEVNVGDAFNEMSGVSAIDDRDGDITNKVEVSGDYDLNKVDVYKLTYTVVDSDLNVSTEETYLIVNDGSIVVQDGYILGAENFMINKDDVNVDATEIINKTKAHAYKISTTEEVDVAVLSTGGYSSTVGEYTITLGVDEKQSVTKTVQASVVKGAVSESDDYYLSANDITIGLEDAAAMSDTDIVTRADAKAVHKTLGTPGNVVVSNKTLVAAAGDYAVTYIVTQDITSGLTRSIKVLDKDIVVEKDDFVIYADNFMVGDKFILEMTKEDIVELAGAGAYNVLNPEVSLPVTQVEDIVTTLGTHTVTFAMTQDASVNTQVTKTIFKDVMYYIEANNAEIEIGTLTKAINNGRLESTLLNLTNAKGYRVEGDGTKVEMPVFVTNKDAFINAKVGADTVATLSLVDPQTKAAAENNRTVDVSTHREEEANVDVKITVNKDKVDDKDGNGKTKDPSTGIKVYTTTFFAMIIAIASMILILLNRKKRKEA